MIKGTLFGIMACFIWGLIFVVPNFMVGFDPFEIALGRHFVNGALSCILVGLQGGISRQILTSSVWNKALVFSLISNIGYYTCLVISVQSASPAVAALIVGISPIVISFYGNWLEKECDYKVLVLPALFILAGLLCINLPLLAGEEQDIDKPYYFLGVLGAFGSMFAWSWYVVANARFLKNTPDITPQQWSSVIGMATFVWVLLLSFIYEGWLGAESWNKFITPSETLFTYVGGCLVLGVLCSWVGTFLWNKASELLPVSYAGQLTIFETVFGLGMFYMIEQQLPPLFELTGVILMLFAIFYGMNTFLTEEAVAE